MKSVQTYQSIHSAKCWHKLPCGEQYQRSITQAIQPWLGKFFGTHLIKLGELSAFIDTSHCLIPHQVVVGPMLPETHLVADLHKLPLLSKSIDACLLIHGLGGSATPHAMLREADRVLIDDGWLIVTEFNPYSLLGGVSAIPGLGKRLTWSHRLISATRIADWLKLLNYQIIAFHSLQSLPWKSTKAAATALPALGSINLWVARKRTYPLTLERKRLAAKQTKLTPAVNVTGHCQTSLPQEGEE